MNLLNIIHFKPYRAGVYHMGENYAPCGKGLAFSFDAGHVLNKNEKAGLIIYDKNSEKKILFDTTIHTGSIYGVCIDEVFEEDVVKYNFLLNDEIILDKNAQFFDGNEKFGINVYPGEVKSCYCTQDYQWSENERPKYKYSDLILYGLNVRAFTEHKSSKVENKGTYEGITEKIPYLKDLGINGVVLMPSYEFDECLGQKNKSNKPKSIEEAKKAAYEDAKNIRNRINCWGFCKGYYLAPKRSYSAGKNPIYGFKKMVEELHNNGIEVFMQFYFPPGINQCEISEILKFWVYEYHIDGFRVEGFYIPHRLLLSEPALKDTKMWFRYIPKEDMQDIDTENNLWASDNGNFRNDIRRFLKGDEGMVQPFIGYQKSIGNGYRLINYLCDYDGFSLRDLYTYERKHNESNGENNSDGTEYNYSWNCGIEGETKKKYIVLLRNKQIKNAIAMLMLCAGTPYIFAGDEFGDTRQGNNNAYCQDNEIGHVVWKDTVSSNEILEFSKKMIRLRRNNKIFRMESEMKNSDTMSVGYPDLSYHGFEAWRPDVGYNSRMLGMFFCGDYAQDNTSGSFYVGINMHWENHRLAVPKLKGQKKFYKIIDTSNSSGTSKDHEIPIGERSIAVFKAE